MMPASGKGSPAETQFSKETARHPAMMRLRGGPRKSEKTSRAAWCWISVAAAIGGSSGGGCAAEIWALMLGIVAGRGSRDCLDPFCLRRKAMGGPGKEGLSTPGMVRKFYGQLRSIRCRLEKWKEAVGRVEVYWCMANMGRMDLAKVDEVEFYNEVLQ